MQKGKALLLHPGVCLHLCTAILLPCCCLIFLIMLPHPPCTLTRVYITLTLPFSFVPHSFFLCGKHSFPSTSLHLFFFPLAVKSHIAKSISPSFLFFSAPCHAPTLMWELRYYACSVVALVWGSLLRPRGGACPIASANRGYWAVFLTGRMNSWRVGGQ